MKSQMKCALLAMLLIAVLASPASARNRRRPNVQRLVQQRQQRIQAAQKQAQQQAAEAEQRRRQEVARRKQALDAKKEGEKREREAAKKAREERRGTADAAPKERSEVTTPTADMNPVKKHN